MQLFPSFWGLFDAAHLGVSRCKLRDAKLSYSQLDGQPGLSPESSTVFTQTINLCILKNRVVLNLLLFSRPLKEFLFLVKLKKQFYCLLKKHYNLQLFIYTSRCFKGE